MADLRHLGKARGPPARRRSCSSGSTWSTRRRSRSRPTPAGMRRRLDLAMTLVGDPRIIFLDEPTAGLDPRSRRVMWQTIRDLVAGGVTIFLTTQYLEEADRLAHRIGVLDRGVLVAEGTPAELKRLVPGGHIRLAFADAADARAGGPGLRRRVARRRVAHPADPERRRGRLAAGPARPARRRLDRRRRALASRRPTSTTSSCRSPATPTTEKVTVR